MHCRQILAKVSGNSSPHDFILSMAFGRGHVNVIMFARSLRTIGSQATFVLLYTDDFLESLSPNELRALIYCGVMLMNIGSISLWSGIGARASRYYLFRSFDRVLIVDMFGIFFQLDPFQKGFQWNKAFCGVENITLKENKVCMS
jgi:hypothetical protein